MDQQEAKRLFEEAGLLFKSGDAAAALDMLDRLAQSFPRHKEVLYARSRVLLALGRLNEAKDAAKTLNEIGDPRAQSLLAPLDNLPHSTAKNEPPSKSSMTRRRLTVISACAFAALVAIVAMFIIRKSSAPERPSDSVATAHAPQAAPAPSASPAELAPLIEAGNIEAIKQFFDSKPDEAAGMVNKVLPDTPFTPLIRAVQMERFDLVEFLIENGADPNADPAKWGGPLIDAARQNSVRIAAYLIQHGANPNAKDEAKQTALMLAAGIGNKEVVEILLNAGADVNAVSIHGGTALTSAAESGNKQIYDMIEKAAAASTSPQEKELVAAAAKGGNAEILQSIEDQHKPLKADESSSVLFTAGSPEILVKLLEAGADVNAQADIEFRGWGLQDGKSLIHDATPLHQFAVKNARDMVSLLIERGADVNARTKEGITPLHCAVAAEGPETTQLLLGKGAKTDSPDSLGRTPLYLAAQIGASTANAEALIAQEANIDAAADDGLTPLGAAVFMAENGNNTSKEIEALLRRRGAKGDQDGRRAFQLQTLVQQGKLDDVRQILKANPRLAKSCTVNIVGYPGALAYGEPLLITAATYSNADMVKLLLENGADPRRVGASGRTALQAAQENQAQDIIDILAPHMDRQKQ